MQISTLMWSNVVVKHEDQSFKDDRINCATLRMDRKDKIIVITEYTSCQGTSGRTICFTKPKVVELTPYGITIDAMWFSYSFITKEHKEHAVTIMADF